METLYNIVFVIIGAINWGLIGIFDFNLVNYIFKSFDLIEKIIYSIVGICGIISIGVLFNNIEAKK